MMRGFLVLLFSFLISGFSHAQTDPVISDTINTKTGLRYIYLLHGSGIKVNYGAKVTVHYTGRLADGRIFDTSASKPIKFRAGKGEVIKGWDEMLLLMRVGDVVTAIIPAKLGYGKFGVPDPENDNAYRIPPDAELTFTIRLMDATP